MGWLLQAHCLHEQIFSLSTTSASGSIISQTRGYLPDRTAIGVAMSTYTHTHCIVHTHSLHDFCWILSPWQEVQKVQGAKVCWFSLHSFVCTTIPVNLVWCSAIQASDRFSGIRNMLCTVSSFGDCLLFYTPPVVMCLYTRSINSYYTGLHGREAIVHGFIHLPSLDI